MDAAAQAVSDVSGRIFMFFVDDQHLQFGNTPRIRQLFEQIAKELVHDGDLFGIVSSGPSSIQVDMTYDRSRIGEGWTRRVRQHARNHWPKCATSRSGKEVRGRE